MPFAETSTILVSFSFHFDLEEPCRIAENVITGIAEMELQTRLHFAQFARFAANLMLNRAGTVVVELLRISG